MSDKARDRTASGTSITNDLVDRLAAKAEAGYPELRHLDAA